MRHLLPTSVVFLGLSHSPAKGVEVPKRQGYYENKGQVHDQHGIKNPAVLYVYPGMGFNVQLRRTGFSYDLFQLPDTLVEQPKHTDLMSQTANEPATKKYFPTHRIDLDLVGANPDATVEAFDPAKFLTNYYTSVTLPEGVEGVRVFQRVVYRAIYPHIDLEFAQGPKGGFKYNFIVHPGGDVADIVLRTSGALSTTLANGEIHLTTRFGELVERIPSCTWEHSGKHGELTGHFEQVGADTFGFGFPDAAIPEGASLLVDPVPTVTWCTYFGGVEPHGVNGMTLYLLDMPIAYGHIVNGTTGMATAGAFMDSTAGDYQDGTLMAFEPQGDLLWFTYFGGNGDDFFYSMTSNSTTIFAGGQTNSDDLATVNPPPAFWNRGMLVSFSPYSGAYIGHTYAPGAITTCIPGSGNTVICGGETESTVGVATPGALEPSHDGSAYTGFVMCYTPVLEIVWGTYLGGGHGTMTGLTRGGPDRFYACGWGIPEAMMTPGTYGDTWQTSDGQQAYVNAFDLSGNRIWGSLYGGPGYDKFWQITYNGGILYVSGESEDFPTTEGAFQHSGYGSDQDNVLVSMDTTSQLRWATYCTSMYGTPGSQGIWAALIGGGIYVTGGPTTLLTLDAWATDGSGTRLAKFNMDGVLQWGTSFPGTGTRRVTDLTTWFGGFDVCGTTDSPNLPVTPGAYQSEPHDSFLTRFQDCNNLPGPAGPISGTVTLACPGTEGLQFSTTEMGDTLEYYWTTPVGWNITAGQGSTSVTITAGPTNGNIRVYLRNACGTGIPSEFAVQADSVPNVTITANGPIPFCADSQLSLSANGADSYVWSTGATGSELVIVQGGSYSVVGTVGACADTSDDLNAYTIPVPSPNITGEELPLEDTVYTYHASGSTNYWQWSILNGTLVGSSLNVQVQWNTTGPGWIAFQTTNNGCVGWDTLFVNVINTMGISEGGDPSWSLYPTVASEELFLILPSASWKPLDYRIVDATGRWVRYGRSASPRERIDVAGLADGTYWLQLGSGSGGRGRRFVVLH